MRVRVGFPVLAAGVNAAAVLCSRGNAPLAVDDHVRPNLINVRAVREIHHVRRIAAGRAHVDFERDEIADAAQAFPRLRQAEKLQMHEAPPRAERRDGLPPERPQRLRNVLAHVIRQIQVEIHDVHDRRRPDRHRLEQNVAVPVRNRVEGTDVPAHEFLHHVGLPRQIFEKAAQLVFPVQRPRVRRADADVRLDDEREPDFPRERARVLKRRRPPETRRRHAARGVKRLHRRLALVGADFVRADARPHVEIRAQPRVLLEPVFVVGFDPVDLPVFEREKRDGAENLFVVFHVVHAVILRERVPRLRRERVVGRVADAEDVRPVSFQAVAEIPVRARELGRDKNEVHAFFFLSFRAVPRIRK